MKKIIAILVIGMFLVTGTLAASAGKLTTETMECLGNSPPSREASQGVWKVTWHRRGMSAPFSSAAQDPENDKCRLCVTISDSSNGARTQRSGYSDDYKKKSVSFSLDPKDYPIGLVVEWDLWVEDIHGAESGHWKESFVIRRSNARSLSMRSVLLEKMPIIQLLQQLLNL